MDRFFILDHLEGILLANAIRKKLDEHLDEEFHQRVSMEVTKRVSNIINWHTSTSMKNTTTAYRRRP
jgi:hypothetical protein